MQREDIDELIELVTGRMDESNCVHLFDRIGIEYKIIDGEVEFDEEQLHEQIATIKQKSELLDYIKTKDKETIGALVGSFPEIFDEDYLKMIIFNREDYSLENFQISALVEEINKPEGIKELIENGRLEEYYQKSLMRKYIEKEPEDLGFVKKFIDENNITGLGLLDLLEGIGYSHFIEQFVEDSTKYKLDKSMVKSFAKYDTKSPDFKKYIIENREKYELNSEDIVKLASEVEDIQFIKKIIGKSDEYGLTSFDVAGLINTIPEKERLDILRENGREVTESYRHYSADPQFIRKNIDEFLEIEGKSVNKELLLRMSEKNEDILKYDFELINERYVEILGEDKVSQISSYPEVVRKILDLNLDDRELGFIGEAIDTYLEETKSDEWTPFTNRMLENISGYKELIASFNNNENIDMKKLLPILIHQNDFDIKTYDDVENFKEIKRKRCEELIKGETVEEKQKAVLLKIFGQNRKEAQELVVKFGQDIDKIEDEDLKSYIKSLQEILNTEDPTTLEEIFNQVEELETSNPVLMERMLKTEYWKLYNNDLFKVEDARKLPDGENVYSAGTDFKMIITSVGAYVSNQPDNYKENWNRASLGSQHFCASYIRNDMLGHAPMPHICYGFEEMKEDSLMLSGPGDIYSSGVSFEPTAGRGEKYLAPDSQIGNTTRYNEMDFRRIQGGEKKQPDYIVVFRKDGRIDNMDKAQKASKDFGGLPIVVIDEDECLTAEKQKAEELFQEYQKTGDSEVKAKLQEKLRNNRVTNASFCRDTNIDAVLENTKQQEEPEKNEEEKQEVSIEDLGEIYEEVSGKERQEEAVRIKAILTQIRDIKRGEVSDGER